MPVPHDRVALTLEGCLQGARMTLPLLPSIIVFAAAFGSLAAQKGMTWDQALAMSGIVFAGASQMVSIEIWREVWSVPALLEIMAVTAFVNAPMILMCLPATLAQARFGPAASPHAVLAHRCQLATRNAIPC